MEEKSDEILIEEYIKGNEDSFRFLIDKYSDSIYNFSARFVGVSEATDIVQDVFVKVWTNVKKFDKSKSSFKTWIFRITRNTVIDSMRKKKMISFSSLDTADEDFEDTIEDESSLPTEIMSRLEDEKMLNDLIDELPDNYKEVLVFHYQEDMTFKEIGELLGKPLNTVKSYHYRALIALKDKLNLHQNY